MWSQGGALLPPTLGAPAPLVPLRNQTKQEIAEEIFDKADRDGRGSLSPKQTAEALTARGVSTTKAWVEGILSVVDSDGSGTIDRLEFPRVYMLALKKREKELLALDRSGSTTAPLPAAIGGALKKEDGISRAQVPAPPSVASPSRGSGRSGRQARNQTED